MKTAFFCLVFLNFFYSGTYGSRKMLLEDVQVLTLYKDKMTSSRRGQAVPQLNCMGGSAGCNAFRPQVVQCYNRGYDGYDVQWECKTDMDNAFRFGKIEVTCEGFDSPEDRYILIGSCGLEYTLDLTKEGHSHKTGNQHDYYSGNSQKSHSELLQKHKSGFGDLIMIAIIALIIYAIYKTCLTSPQHQYSSTASDYPGDDSNQNNRGGGVGGGGWFGNAFGNNGYGNTGPTAPPPYGFRQEHYDAGCGGARPQNRGNNFGGFWTGATAGGILGYMFGNRNQGAGYHRADYQPRSSWTNYSGGDAFGGTSSSMGSSSSSSGTRTASAFNAPYATEGGAAQPKRVCKQEILMAERGQVFTAHAFTGLNNATT